MSLLRYSWASCYSIKRASRAGLVGLAVADLLCCLTALAVTYGRDDDVAAYSQHQQVRVLSAVYGPFIQNACAKSNTWLTVVVAIGRYMVICRPLQARYVVSYLSSFSLLVFFFKFLLLLSCVRYHLLLLCNCCLFFLVFSVICFFSCICCLLFGGFLPSFVFMIYCKLATWSV